MKMPWHNQTGLAKAAAVLATAFVVAIGLCGANYVAVMKFVPWIGIVTPSIVANWMNAGLTITGFVEMAVMVLSVLGLFLIAIIMIARAIKKHFTY